MYKIQIGAYKYKENAITAKDLVTKAGFKAVVIQSDDLYKVQAGAFLVEENAKKHLAALQKKFPNAILIDTGTPAVQTAWDKVLTVLNGIMSAKDPHQRVIDILKKHGHTLKESSAWCSETVVAAFLEAGLGDLIGGYSANAPSLKKKAKALGIWHSDSSGIKAGDIVLYGSGDPNHTEIAIDDVYNISGNYNGTVAKRKRAGRTINGYIRPEYPDQTDSKIRVWGINFFEKNESLYGDATAIIQYNSAGKPDHVVLIDTGMGAGQTVAKLKAAGVKVIDALVISHAHGDHYGAVSDVFKNFTVKHLYLPDIAGLQKYQKTYASAIISQQKKAKKFGAGCTYMKAGSSFTAGKIRCDCIYQAPAASLSVHDSHYFVNNQSIVLRFTLDGIWKYHTAGDLQNEGNNLLVKAVRDLRADIFKFQWHGDANAINSGLMEAIRPKIAFSNYHHKEGSGRGTTRKRAEAVGAVVARNHENGDIYIDCQGNTMKLSCSKGNLSKTFVK